MANPPFLLALKASLELAYSDGISRVLDWHLNGSELTGRFLDGNELFNFTVSAKGITFQQTEIPKHDAWLTGFIAQAQRSTGLLYLDKAEGWLDHLLATEIRADRSADGKSQCRIGRSCGEGCISKEKQCRVATPMVKSAAVALVRRATTEAKDLEKAHALPSQAHSADPVAVKPAAKGAKPERSVAELVIRAHEDTIRLNPTESAFAVDREGKVIFQKQGEAESVSVTPSEMRLLKGTIFTHNHPSSYQLNYNQEEGPRYEGAGFSEADLRSSCIAEIAELRAVAPEARFSLKPPAEGWNSQYWDEKLGPTYKKYDLKAYGELMEAYHKGEKTVADINLELPHRVLSLTAKELGLEYTREPILITDEDIDRMRQTDEDIDRMRPSSKPHRKPNYWKGLVDIAATGALLALLYYQPPLLSAYGASKKPTKR